MAPTTRALTAGPVQLSNADSRAVLYQEQSFRHLIQVCRMRQQRVGLEGALQRGRAGRTPLEGPTGHRGIPYASSDPGGTSPL